MVFLLCLNILNQTNPYDGVNLLYKFNFIHILFFPFFVYVLFTCFDGGSNVGMSVGTEDQP